MEQDIRWIQRFQNFNKAFTKLESAILVLEKTGLSELEREGLIQRFEYTHELAWNVMKDFFEMKGTSTIMGSRSATREAFKKGLIIDGENWMDMINSRNLTTHTYNEEVVDEITNKIIASYYPAFKEFQTKMTAFLG
ncbi:nucleotidyltransferase substrate binding protein [Dyadobacter sp. CY356]|uniref:nucleotidyltransferase substrate binding protein n=1 Tax=Dyadobacter sp. CY356 TaxID=2906442 RepID=UPI001F462A19|nr:nucleotidyltransferase substrate binding protein [Dyadobacter sp. CY356]MCF0056624.1 nucleotidyltransferase substrate binding protein [Dyadobacter sp. CY356]